MNKLNSTYDTSLYYQIFSECLKFNGGARAHSAHNHTEWMPSSAWPSLCVCTLSAMEMISQRSPTFPCPPPSCCVYCCGAQLDDAEAFPSTLMWADTEPPSLLFTSHYDSRGPVGRPAQVEDKRRGPTVVSGAVGNRDRFALLKCPETWQKNKTWEVCKVTGPNFCSFVKGLKGIEILQLGSKVP